MSEATFNPRRFRSTVPFYARYRLGYPESLIARVAAFVGLRAGDAVMDLGCGPGLLAVPFARLGMHVVAVDPEPDMVNACREAAAGAGVAVDVRQGSSYALPDGVGPFRLVTMGRSFHWMDREATLAVLDGVALRDGALAFFDDHHPDTHENAWRRASREVSVKYGRNSSPNVAMRAAADFRSEESLLLDSAFPHLAGLSEVVRRSLTADDIVGLSLSQSTSSPERLGEKARDFEADLRAALKALSPTRTFTEIATVTALVAKR